jgi:hypothetical protein
MEEAGKLEWSDQERETYPGGAGRISRAGDTTNLDELMRSKPGPLPVVAILLIVFWLRVPFIMSVVFLAVVLGIFGAADYNGRDHYRIEQPLEDMNQFLSNIMHKREHAGPLTAAES